METQNNSVTRIFKRFHRKFIKETIQRHKRKTKWYWPELHLYCGICDLKTGLYIRSLISVIIYGAILVINMLILYHLVAMGATMASMEISDIEEYLGVNFNEVKIVKVKMVYKVIISYMVFFIIFKFIYIGAVFCTIYAIYKKKPNILKSVIYISAINWSLDLFTSAIGILLLQIMSKVMAVLCILFEGYNLIALNSEYKQLRGKSKLLINLNPDVGFEIDAASLPSDSNQSESSDIRVTENRKHCETCTCISKATGSIAETSTSATENVINEGTSDPNQNLESEQEAEKLPNIKDVETIFNQDMLVTNQSVILEAPPYVPCVNDTLVNRMNGQRVVRPHILQLRPCSEEKIDIADVPTIYDKSQLNVGGSPVVEDHPQQRQ